MPVVNHNPIVEWPYTTWNEIMNEIVAKRKDTSDQEHMKKKKVTRKKKVPKDTDRFDDLDLD